MREFQGKVAVVTGAASGMGKAFIMDFVRRGMKVVLLDIETKPLATAAEQVRAMGAEVLALECDVSKLEQVRAAADAAFQRFGAVHVLCNNAGVGEEGPMHEAIHREWEWIIGVNLWGVIHGVEAFVPRMVAQRQGGHIVNTSSMSGLFATKNLGVYNTSKFAVVGLSESLRMDMRPHGIGVSVLCPMGVRTGVFNSARNKPPDLTKVTKEIDVNASLAGWLEPEQVSAMVMRAIENNELYILTHKELATLLEGRFERIRRAYPSEH